MKRDNVFPIEDSRHSHASEPSHQDRKAEQRIKAITQGQPTGVARPFLPGDRPVPAVVQQRRAPFVLTFETDARPQPVSCRLRRIFARARDLLLRKGASE